MLYKTRNRGFRQGAAMRCGQILAMALAAALMLGLCGCAWLFNREYYSAEDYEAAADTTGAGDATGSISSYAALKRAVSTLVAEHAESAELTFQNYEGSISQDISTACWEVKSSTPLGAFAVDYISYDLSRIVSFYQAEIYITYKRSAFQIESLEAVGNLTALDARLESAIRAGETYLVLQVTAAAVTGEHVSQAVGQAYYADPTACPVLPAAEIGVFPDSGVEHVLEITLDYGLDGDSLALRREELAAAVEAMTGTAASVNTEDVPDETEPEETPAASQEADAVQALCEYISGQCRLDDEAGATAWDALVAGEASSEGMAMALAAGCRALDIGCAVVSGRLQNEPHVWNIVTVDGQNYHVDVSVWDGDAVPFFADDGALAGAYWWDTGAYPACPEPYGAQQASSDPGIATEEIDEAA